jgi:hypothetical protein
MLGRQGGIPYPDHAKNQMHLLARVWKWLGAARPALFAQRPALPSWQAMRALGIYAL